MAAEGDALMAFDMKDPRILVMRSGCWEWQGSRTKQGYGRIGNRYVHRLVAATLAGPCPSGMEVMHACDNPPCCNPAHLRYGTRRENMRDASERGLLKRASPVRGVDHGKARLTEQDVRDIRTMRRQGATLADIAAEFGVHFGTIHRVVTRKTWSHVA